MSDTERIAYLERRLREAEERLSALLFRSVPQRVAALLLHLSADGIVLGYTQQELAEMVGAYRETTTSTLSAFQHKGLIRVGRKRIEILSCDELKAIAYAPDECLSTMLMAVDKLEAGNERLTERDMFHIRRAQIVGLVEYNTQTDWRLTPLGKSRLG